MSTVTYPLYSAQYETPAGEMLYGTAQETPRGYVFIDELGVEPFYTTRTALVLCGEVPLADAQQAEDRQRAAWVLHMRNTGCQVAA